MLIWVAARLPYQRRQFWTYFVRRLETKATGPPHDTGVGSVRLIRASLDLVQAIHAYTVKVAVHTVYGSRDLPLASMHYSMCAISGVFSDSCVAVLRNWVSALVV